MGTWATGNFADDEACDARDAYLAILNRGLDGPEATDRFLRGWKSAMNDSDDGPVIWFALAETQWKLGRLEDRVRDKAIELIDSGESLDRWREQSDKLAEKRNDVLLALKKKLRSKQPARKPIKVKKPTKIAAWKKGELFAFRLKSGRSVVLCLDDVDEGHHGSLSALKWIGEDVPGPKELKALPRHEFGRLAIGKGKCKGWFMVAYKKRDVPYDRMTRLEAKIKPLHPAECDRTVYSWDKLDEVLRKNFKWE